MDPVVLEVADFTAGLARRQGRTSLLCTLEYNDRDFRYRLDSLGLRSGTHAHKIVVDTSDDINAQHVIDRLDGLAGETIVVIDYLQLLDQKRSNPSLDEQLEALSAYAKSNGSIIVMISQVDRFFDLTKKTMPDMSNIRMPNRFDTAYFDKTCFLHEGDIQLTALT